MALSKEKIQELSSITNPDDRRNYHLSRIADALEEILLQLQTGGSNPLAK